MTITCVEQARTTIQLATLPYTVTAPFGVLNYHNANNFAYACDGPVLQYGCSETGPTFTPVSIPSMTVQFLGQTAAVETDYGTAPGADTQIDTNVIFWNCRAVWSTTGFVGPGLKVFCYDVAFDAGTSEPAITYVNETIPSNSNPTGTGASPFLWSGLTDPFLVASSWDHVAGGAVSGILYDGSGFTNAALIVTIPSPIGGGGNNFEPDMIKPDPANNRNLFLSRNQNGDPAATLNWCAAADSTTGANIFADTLTFSASDVVGNLVGFGNDISWEVRPDGWYAWNVSASWNAHGSITVPTDVSCVLVRISNDFTKYWVYYFTWLPGDATAQNIIENADIQQILFDGTFVYYQELDFPGTVLSAVFTIPAGAPALIAPPFACSPGPPSPTITGGIGETYFSAPPALFDLSNPANRAKFHDASLNPVNLGPVGVNPTGLPATVYLSRQGGAPSAYATNVGNGGTFTISGGTLDDAGVITGS